MSRRAIAALVFAAAALSSCGDAPAPDTATSEAQVQQRMSEYNLMQISPGSGATLCSYMAPDTREAWKEDNGAAANAIRDDLPPTVVDCKSNWDHLISMVTANPKLVEMIRTAQVTDVEVTGERATATLSFGGTFEWHWHDGRWLLN